MPQEKTKLNDIIEPTKQVLNEPQKKAMRNRALGVALVLAAFVVLIYLGALAKLGG